MGKSYINFNLNPLIYNYMFTLNTPIDRLYEKWSDKEFEEKHGHNIQDLIACVDGACNTHRHTTIKIIEAIVEEIDG